MKRVFSLLLAVSLVLTLLVPFTGVVVHKLASTVFLLLCLGHTVASRKKMGPRRWALLGAVVLAFVSGVLSLVFAAIPWVLALHKAISITCGFFLAIHIFAYRRGFRGGVHHDA